MSSHIVLLCHGNWGQNLYEDYVQYFGTNIPIKVFPLRKDTEAVEYYRDVDAYVNQKKDEILICDLYGSTTFQTALSIALKYGLLAYSGLSLQLLMEISCLLDQNVERTVFTDELCRQSRIKTTDLVSEFQKFNENGEI